MTNEQLNSPDTLCAKCGAEARWNFLDEAKQAVEVVCPNCGRIEMTVAEFEQAEFDTAPAEERRSWTAARRTGAMTQEPTSGLCETAHSGIRSPPQHAVTLALCFGPPLALRRCVASPGEPKVRRREGLCLDG